MGIWNSGKEVVISDKTMWMKHMVRNKNDVEKMLPHNGFTFHTLTLDKFWEDEKVA